MTFYLTALLLGLAFSALATGVFVSMKIFNIPDITTDGSFTLGGALTAVLTVSNLHPLLILPLAFLAGSIAGMFTAMIHTRLKVNALLAGILVMTALYSVNLSLMGRSNIPLIQQSSLYTIIQVTSDNNLNQALILTVFTVLLFILITRLFRTDFGLSMRATGNNETMVRSLGVNADGRKVMGLMLANGLTAISGCLITWSQGYADINMGIGIVVLGLGSVMIGEILTEVLGFRSIAGRVAGVIAGCIIFRMLLAMALTLGIDPLWLKLVTAALVLTAVGLPQLRKST